MAPPAETDLEREAPRRLGGMRLPWLTRLVSCIALVLAVACGSDEGTPGAGAPGPGDGGNGDAGASSGTVDRCAHDARVAVWFPANAGEPEVAYFAADLAAAANLTRVTVLGTGAPPSAEELRASYDAIIVGSDWGFGSETADRMGDLLADYVDAGGVVIDSMFDHTTWTGMGTQESLGGRWLSGGYNSMVSAEQIEAPAFGTALTLDRPTDPLVAQLDPEAFVEDLKPLEPLYVTAGAVNTNSSLSFVELAHWSFEGEDHPAIVVSTDDDRRVLGLVLSPILNLNTTNTDGATRDFFACSISQLVR